MNQFMNIEDALNYMPVHVPPRSALFSLSPIGVGTPHQESLLSLLVRTSRAHAVSPRHLVGEVLGAADTAIAKLADTKFFSIDAGTVNGLGQYAELFVSAAERLTGHQNLGYLTLLPWQDLFPYNGQGLLARHPRWCPACLYQQRLLGQATVYPLRWYIEAYRACSEHMYTLEDHCSYCGKTQPYIPRFPDIGICDNCRKPLAGTRPREDIPRFQLWVNDAIGDMVLRQSEPDFAPSVDRFRDFVREQIHVMEAGNRAAFCRSVGFNDRGLNGLLIKGERTSAPQFLALCYSSQVMPTDVFAVAQHSIKGTGMRLPPSKLKDRGICPRPSPQRRKELEDALHVRLNSEEGLSVKKIADDLGVSGSCLRYWFPELCALLSKRHKVAAKARSAIQQERQSHRVEEVVRLIHMEGRYPSQRQVDYVLRKEGMSLVQPPLMQAYLKALKDMSRRKTGSCQ